MHIYTVTECFDVAKAFESIHIPTRMRATRMRAHHRDPSAATRMWARRHRFRAPTACRSTRCRSCSRSRCATAGPMSGALARPGATDRRRSYRPGRGGRHVGAARQPDQLRGRHRRLRECPARPRRRRRSPAPIAPAGCTVEAAPPGTWEREARVAVRSRDLLVLVAVLYPTRPVRLHSPRAPRAQPARPDSDRP